MKCSTVLLMAALLIGPVGRAAYKTGGSDMNTDKNRVQLPQPRLDSDMSLEKALAKRRSVRSFKPKQLSPEQLSQLLWAGQGITEKRWGYRTAPSAGALYPMQLYIVTIEGIYVYEPAEHRLTRIFSGDIRDALCEASLSQGCVRQAACNIVIAASREKLAVKYHARAMRYLLLEAGHIAQNIQLQAVAMKLGAVAVGAFEDEKVKRLCRLEAELEPVLIIPVGYPKGDL